MPGIALWEVELSPNGMRVHFPKRWVDVRGLEESLAANDPLGSSAAYCYFEFPVGCKVMVDAAVRILSLANQIDKLGKFVTLQFLEGEVGTMGYLDRLGFFDCLSDGIRVDPPRPRVSGALLHHGQSRALLEIRAISPNDRDQNIPSELTDRLQESMSPSPKTKRLGRAAYTVFGELIDNIFEHSSTEIDGYAALQVYPGGGRVKVAVSDSGTGILQTLRPALEKREDFAGLSDTEIIVQAFNEGISRFGEDRGCGLKACADNAIRFKAELDVRLCRCRVHLTPSADGYQPNVAWCTEGLPLIEGTHLCFDRRRTVCD